MMNIKTGTEIETETDKINFHINESKNIMTRVVQKLNETNEIGTETLATLDHQTEQINQIDNSLNSIRVNIKNADKDINQINSIWYSIYYYFFGKKKTDTRNYIIL